MANAHLYKNLKDKIHKLRTGSWKEIITIIVLQIIIAIPVYLTAYLALPVFKGGVYVPYYIAIVVLYSIVIALAYMGAKKLSKISPKDATGIVLGVALINALYYLVTFIVDREINSLVQMALYGFLSYFWGVAILVKNMEKKIKW